MEYIIKALCGVAAATIIVFADVAFLSWCAKKQKAKEKEAMAKRLRPQNPKFGMGRACDDCSSPKELCPQCRHNPVYVAGIKGDYFQQYFPGCECRESKEER